VGRPHPLRAPAQAFFEEALDREERLVTSAEVLQELLHAYLPVGRRATLDAATELARSLTTVWPLEADDVDMARSLLERHPGLGARDLVHLATCVRRQVSRLHTFDRDLADAFAAHR
jgi:predicted nucleic acid-binding protein